MTLLLLLHAALGLLILALGARLGRWALAVGGVGPAAAVAWLISRWRDVVDGQIVSESVDWIPNLGLAVDLRLDGFAALMVVLVSGIGVLVFAYGDRYFPRGTPRTARLAALLTLFSGSMLGLVLADNLLVLYGFWELTSITSFLLIGDDHEDPNARGAALQALLVTGAGALAMLAGFLVIGQAAGTYQLRLILADPPGGTRVTVALVLVLLGAFTKSAQFPFHSWLTGAMVAPTPISAYLHSATMVKAGVYLVARLAPAYDHVALWRPLVVSVGVATMLAGGLRALRQTDLKLLLALGTISQLGFMIAVFGWGTPLAMTAGCVTLLAHGLFKAAAFMVVGVVDHQAGTRDVRRVPQPGPGWWPVTVTTIVAASMAGVPLLFGFVAKELDFEALAHDGVGGAFVLAGVVAGSLLTAAYSLRFAAGMLGRLNADEARPPPVAAPGLAFAAPALLLAVASGVLGVAPNLADGLVEVAAGALDTTAGAVHLALWHGLTLELGLSPVALAGGALLFVGRRPVGRILARGEALPSAAAGYGGLLRGLGALAHRVTAVAQPGSLPVYLGVILLTAAAVPSALLLTGPWWPGWPDAAGVLAHVAIATVLLGGALAAAIVRRRFSAALFLGVVGYAMAGLFVIEGAPDLALTQVAIETLTTVLFVLVLRRLPDRFARDTIRRRRLLRRVIAAAVGAAVFVLTLGFGTQDPPTTVSDEMIVRSLPDGDGRNVVNVTLVDFRGFDTLGEITVLAAAAIGTVALARAGRRPTRSPAPSPPRAGVDRLITLDVSVRIVFAAVMVGSLWLLFAGHNQPGGGFVGGIVAGAAVALRYIAGGIADVRRLSRSRPWIVLGAGVLVAVAVAIAPLLVGGAVLESASATLDVPVLGTVKLTSVLAFDIGVYLAVIGLALMVFESFGDELVEGAT